MNAPLSLEDAVEVESVARGSKAERIGLVPGDVILRFGRHAPSEAIEAPTIIGLLGRHETLTVLRGDVVFRLAVGPGPEGAEYVRARPLEGIALPAEDGDWIPCHGALRRGKGMLVLPDETSAIWALVPLVCFARHHLWQMAAATALVYGIAAAMGAVPFVLAYVTSMVTVAIGGPALMRDAAVRQGWQPTARLQLAAEGDAPKLEVATAERWKIETEKAAAAAAASTARTAEAH